MVHQELVELLRANNYSLAVAESLTGGLLSDTFARLPHAGEWFKGGLVAYAPDVKRRLLEIGASPVVSKHAAIAMAESAAKLMCADIAVAVTGVGGPGPEDGVAPGSVWMAVCSPRGVTATFHDFPGQPIEVCRQACDAAVAALCCELRERNEAN